VPSSSAPSPQLSGPQVATSQLPEAQASLADDYASRRAAALDAAGRLEARSRVYSRARLGLAGLAVLALFGATGAAWLSGLQAAVVIVASIGAFLAVAVRHDRVERGRQRAEAVARLCDEAIARVRRQWNGMPARGAAAMDAPVTTDLDLDGPASLRQLIGRAATPAGDACLTRWMHEATRGPADVASRQAAVRELAPRLDHRFDLIADGMIAPGLRAASAAGLTRWIDSGPSVLARPAVGLAFAVIPAGFLVLAALESQGYRLASWWLALPALSWGLRAWFRRDVGRALAGSDALSGEVRPYAGMFARWEGLDVSADRLVALRAALSPDGASASAVLTRLGRLIDVADLRWSHLPHVFVHSLTGWDLHVACALERWRARAGHRIAPWFEALAELDALATVAGLAHDEPGWVDPVIDPRADTLTADGLAHPLLAAGVRVANAVEVGPPGTVLAITGSNMSGKSTLLRALGLNVVLAQMGSPVCATRLTLPPVRLATSIRIADSLAEGVSYFMSALLRIREVVEAAELPRAAAGPRVLYLLDEVLQGTNSEERQIAIRHIVRHLVRCDAIGALTTHDLRLVEAPEFIAHARHVHFTEHITEQTTEAGFAPLMTFDYTLRPGPATSRNALALVRLVGLGDPRDAGDS
jgi:ABC-type multidrug transport system fused ATPase/permease subunit